LNFQSLDEPDAADRADEFAPATGPAVSVPGDLWLLGEHRLYCGNALDEAAYAILMCLTSSWKAKMATPVVLPSG
jgi:hypothetical protein